MRQRTSLQRRLLAGLALASLLTLASGCGSSGSDSTNSTKSDPAATAASSAAKALAPYLRKPENIPDYPPLPKPAPRGKQLVFLQASPQATVALIAQGAQDAARAVGWRYRPIRYDLTNPAAPNSAMLSAINAGADVIVATSVATQQIRQGLQAAKAKHIPVVIVSPSGNAIAPDNGVTAQVAAPIPTTAPVFGKPLALMIVADAQAHGTVAHVGMVSSPQLAALFKPVEDALVATGKQYCPNCTFQHIDVPLQDIQTGNGGKDVVSFLQAHPEVNYLNFDAGLLETGVRAALDKAGLSKVKIFGNVPSSAQVQEMNQGGSTGWLLIPQPFNGWLAVDAALRALTGGDPSIHDEEGDPVWAISAKSQVSDDPLPVFPVNYREQFAKLWHVG